METMKKDIFDKIMSSPVLSKFYPLYQKRKSVLLYIFFGGLTTAVSIGTFAFCNSIFAINELVSNIFSWIAAVTFAYLTNRTWVFNSEKTGKAIITEMIAFFGGRVTTLVIEELILLVFVTLLHLNGLLIKVLAQFIVLVLNYFISKIMVFSGEKNGKID